jgi:hypothetical protein
MSSRSCDDPVEQFRFAGITLNHRLLVESLLCGLPD